MTMSTLQEWEAYFRDTSEPTREDPLFINLMASGSGVPDEFRRRIWQVLIPQSPPVVQYYSVLVEYALSLPNQLFFEQIDKDMARMPPHWTPATLASIKRILLAYSIRNPLVGYVQGMEYTANCLLYVLPEEDAFWGLCLLMEDVLYQNQFETTLGDIMDMLRRNLPEDIQSHPDVEQTFPMMLALYLTCGTRTSSHMHTEEAMFLKIMDRVLFEKQVGLFKISLAYLRTVLDANISLLEQYEKETIQVEALRLPESTNIPNPISMMHQLLFFPDENNII